MNFFDPLRRRVNDTPELINFHVAIPRLTLWPRADGTTQISAMIPATGQGSFVSRQVSRNVADTDIAKIVESYRNDPEGTLETLFNISLAPTALEPGDADFARDLRRERNAKAPAPTSASSLASKAALVEL